MNWWEFAEVTHSWPCSNMVASASLVIISWSWYSSLHLRFLCANCHFVLGLIWYWNDSQELPWPWKYFSSLLPSFVELVIFGRFRCVSTAYVTFKTCVDGRGYWGSFRSPDFLHPFKYILDCHLVWCMRFYLTWTYPSPCLSSSMHLFLIYLGETHFEHFRKISIIFQRVFFFFLHVEGCPFIIAKGWGGPDH